MRERQKLPDGPEWSYEVKLDGYRLVAVRNEADPILFSRRANILNARFPTIAAGLAKLPKETVIDGEVVALDDQGRASFQSLQNFKTARIHYYAFDILVLERRSLLHLPLEERRAILNEVLPRNQDITTSVVVHGPAIRMLKFVQDNGLEGVIAKRSDSIYEPGKRSGLWCKHRIDQGQVVVLIDFAEWTGADRLRHAAFVALRDDKQPRKVVKEES